MGQLAGASWDILSAKGYLALSTNDVPGVNDMKHPAETRSIRAWHVALGVPAAFVALGFSLLAMGPATFTIGATLGYAGLAWLLFDWWVFSKQLSFGVRLAGSLGTVILAMVLSWLVFRPAPIAVNFLRMIEKYADGVEIAGIKWSSKYSGIRVVLRNDADFQYTNVEFLMRTDVMIAAVGFNTKFSQCSAKPTLGAVEISGASIAPDGKNAIPLELPMADVFKVVCDRLLPHDPVEIVVATRRNIVTGGFDAASAIVLRGSFEAFLRSRRLEKQECLIAGCTIPALP